MGIHWENTDISYTIFEQQSHSKLREQLESGTRESSGFPTPSHSHLSSLLSLGMTSFYPYYSSPVDTLETQLPTPVMSYMLTLQPTKRYQHSSQLEDQKSQREVTLTELSELSVSIPEPNNCGQWLGSCVTNVIILLISKLMRKGTICRFSLHQ